MIPALAQGSEDALQATSLELIKLYTRFAITLNSFDVSAKSYEARTDLFSLSTTQNIAPHLRLPMEIDVVLNKVQLVERYRGECIEGACQDFVVRLVSVIDAGLEDIYDLAIGYCEPALTEKRRQSRIRGAWGTDDQGRTEIATYLIDVAGLQSPPNRRSTVDMVFDRYCEIREVRNALVHNGAQVADKHRHRLAELQARLPEDLRNGSLATAPFLAGNAVQLRLEEVLAIRHWAYTAILGFLRAAIQHSRTAA
jgi:hypothetical protein